MSEVKANPTINREKEYRLAIPSATVVKTPEAELPKIESGINNRLSSLDLPNSKKNSSENTIAGWTKETLSWTGNKINSGLNYILNSTPAQWIIEKANPVTEKLGINYVADKTVVYTNKAIEIASKATETIAAFFRSEENKKKIEEIIIASSKDVKASDIKFPEAIANYSKEKRQEEEKTPYSHLISFAKEDNHKTTAEQAAAERLAKLGKASLDEADKAALKMALTLNHIKNPDIDNVEKLLKDSSKKEARIIS